MTAKKLFTLSALIVALAITSCKREPKTIVNDNSAEVPDLPEEVFDYPASHDDNLATLGRVLFYDKELSANKNISCGSCHKQENAFTDNLRFSKGTNNEETRRNTPSIFHRNGRLFWDGRSGSVESLVLQPVRDEIEMDVQNMNYLVQHVSSIDYYKFLFRKAFPSAPTAIDSNKIKSALADFVRNFNFSNNKFHRSQKGQDQLNQSEELGKNLFFGKAKCSSCHHIIPQFNSGGYGVTDESHNIGLDVVNKDRGVAAVTGRAEDEGSFMMPVLLNIELTAPYMHDGRFNTLEEVVEHYNSEVKENPNLDPILKDYSGKPRRLNLTATEKEGLVDFLKTLTDPSILTDEKFSNPFVARP